MIFVSHYNPNIASSVFRCSPLITFVICRAGGCEEEEEEGALLTMAGESGPDVARSDKKRSNSELVNVSLV